MYFKMYYKSRKRLYKNFQVVSENISLRYEPLSFLGYNTLHVNTIVAEDRTDSVP